MEAEVGDEDDVGVSQLAADDGFAAETLGEHGVVAKVLMEDLDGVAGAEGTVFCAIDCAHAAFAEKLDQSEVADGGAEVIFAFTGDRQTTVGASWSGGGEDALTFGAWCPDFGFHVCGA